MLPIPVRKVNKYTQSEWDVILGDHESVQHLLLALGDVSICRKTIQAHRRLHGLKSLPDRYAPAKGPKPKRGWADDEPTGLTKPYVPSAIQAEPRSRAKFRLHNSTEPMLVPRRMPRRKRNSNADAI